MRHPTTILTLALVLGLFATFPALAQDADSLIIQGKRMMRAGFNMADYDQVREARALFERATNDEHRSAWAHYYVALADYNLANLLAQNDKGAAGDHLDSAIEHLKAGIEREESAEAYALLSSVYGRKIGFKPLMGMFLGPKADKALDRAKELEPDNPRAILTEAVSDFNTPKMFGGSKARAMEGFQRAIDLFGQEEATDPLLPRWGHEDAYAWLGIAHNDKGDTTAARRAFEQALAVNPDYGWVKYVLLPGLDAEAGSN